MTKIKINKVKVILFILLFSIVLFIKNAILGSIVLIIIGLIFPDLILLELLILPVIENSMIATQGVTISKIVIIVYIIYFIGFIILKKPIILFKKLKYFFLFLILSYLGVINALSNIDIVSFAGGAGKILFEFFLVNFPRLILFLLLYIFYVAKQRKIIYSSLVNIKIILPFVLPLILIFFLLNQDVTYWLNIVARHTLEKMDPNEYSVILASLLPYLLLNIYESKNKIFGLLNYAGLFIIFYIVISTASKAGLFSFLFAVLITIYANKWFRLSSKTFFLLSAVLLFILIVINSDIFNINTVLLRFSLTDTNLSSLTTKRSDLWMNAIEYFPKRPLIGFGLTTYASRYVNLLGVGNDFVMHNTLFQVLIQLGLLGGISFYLLVKTPFTNNYLIKQKDKTLILPFLSMLILLFGSMSLSWLWRDVIWINLAMCYAISTKFNLNENT